MSNVEQTLRELNSPVPIGNPLLHYTASTHTHKYMNCNRTLYIIIA